MYPTSSRASEFATNGTKRKLLAPECGCRSERRDREFIVGSATRNQHRLVVRVLDVGGENMSLHVCTASGQQNIVRGAINGKDGGPDGFLEEVRDPPVTLLVKGADRDSSDNNRSTLNQGWESDGTLDRTWLR